MDRSKRIAALLGPSLVAVTVTESVNAHIWAASTASAVYLNGLLLFVAGLAIALTALPVCVLGAFLSIRGFWPRAAPERS